MTGSRVFLVVEPVALIAEDLAQCIGDHHPEAVVLRAAKVGDALRALAGHSHVTAAIVHCDPHGFCGTALGLALAARRAKVVFMGSRADMAAEGTLLRLRSPFDSDTVQMMLECLSESSDQGQTPGMTPEV